MASQGEGRKTKRSLFQSPFSSKKEPPKKARTVAELDGGRQQEGESSLVDVASIHETVMLRVNETLSSYKSKEGDSDSPLIRQLIPALATAISVAVGEIMAGVLRDLDGRYSQPSPTCYNRLMATVTRLTYENDRLQQYTRRESVRVFGIKQEESETADQVEEKVLEVFTKVGADIKLEDMAVVHRVGKLQHGSRPVLVKFVSRRKRREVMEKKKALKGKAGCEKVFINDDLTPLRARLLGYVKRLECVERAWTVEGRVMCVKRLPPGHAAAGSQKPIALETPDDLFSRLGVDSVDFSALGLSHLVDDTD